MFAGRHTRAMDGGHSNSVQRHCTLTHTGKSLSFSCIIMRTTPLITMNMPAQYEEGQVRVENGDGWRVARGTGSGGYTYKPSRLCFYSHAAEPAQHGGSCMHAAPVPQHLSMSTLVHSPGGGVPCDQCSQMHSPCRGGGRAGYAYEFGLFCIGALTNGSPQQRKRLSIEMVRWALRWA